MLTTFILISFLSKNFITYSINMKLNILGSHSETTSNANSNGGRKSRDEKTIQELGIPYTMDK